MTRRNSSLWTNSSAAITPVLHETGRPVSEVDKLRAELRSLRGLLALERKRHGKIETAFAKYVTLLEQQLTVQREAVELLGHELIPVPSWGRRKQ